ncbi:Chitinase 2 [Oleoguttula sp. CCFEE 5521]
MSSSASIARNVVAALALVTQATARLALDSSSNVAVYWGQNSINQASGPNAQQRLVDYCANTNIDVIPLAFLYQMTTGTGGEPVINFANQASDCQIFAGTNLLDCPTIGADITTCQQQYGKTILLSIGGATYTEGGFTSSAQAISMADQLWELFGPVAGGTPTTTSTSSATSFSTTTTSTSSTTSTTSTTSALSTPTSTSSPFTSSSGFISSTSRSGRTTSEPSKSTSLSTLLLTRTVPVTTFSTRLTTLFFTATLTSIPSSIFASPTTTTTPLPLLNDTLTLPSYVNSTFTNATIANTTITNSVINNSIITNSTINNSVFINSTITNSIFINSTIINPQISDSTLAKRQSAVLRPFGSAAIDGFDLDIETVATNMVPFAQRLRELMDADTTKQRYLTAAPQCVYPDVANSALLSSTVHLDAIFVQFYNNPCGVQAFVPGAATQEAFNFAAWDTWAKTVSANPAIKVLLGVPGGPSAAGLGYVDASTLAGIISYCKSFSSFGGVMMWDASQALANGGFLADVKSALVGSATRMMIRGMSWR